MSPIGIHGSCHAPNGIAPERGSSLNHRGDSSQGTTPVAGGEPRTYSVKPGPGRPGVPDHGCAGGWAHRRVAYARGVLTRGRGACTFRCGTLGTSSPVRHGCRGASHSLGVFDASSGQTALDGSRVRTSRSPRAWSGWCEQGNSAAHVKKNDLKPWCRLMWCIGVLSDEYRQRMYALLELYARPMSRAEPVICIDEKSLQLIGDSRQRLPMAPHSPAKQDYEYVRNGTTNLFVAVEPKAGRRVVSVTAHRGKSDFVAFIDELLTGAYANARRIHLVMDNLNTHFRKCFDDVLGQRAANKLLRRVEFHYTPKHASWLNMAEIEIGILARQCLDRRIANRDVLKTEVDAWQQARNAQRRTIEWSFTRQDADRKLGRHYVSQLTC